MSSRPLRVAIWAAVSSRRQAEEDRVSLDDQEKAGLAWAEGLGAEIVNVYRVPGHTRDIWNWNEAEREMPAYRQLREDAQAGKLDLLWAYDMDRLGRDPALGQQVISLVEKSDGPNLPRAEVYVASSPHVVGSKTIGHRYIGAIQSVRAGEDQEMRVRRFKMGMKGRVLRHGLMGTTIPAGYTRVKDGDGKTTGYALDDNAPAVDTVTRLYLDGLPYAEVARRMNESGYRYPGGRPWRYYDIGRIIRNDAYAGRPRLGPLQWEGEPQYPAIWDDATWTAVQRERQRRRVAPQVSHGGNPYSGVLFCARCGGGMNQVISRTGGRVYLYYRCQTHARQTEHGRSCHCNFIARWKVTSALVAYFYSLQTPERVDALLAEYGDSADAERLRGEIAAAEKAAKETEVARYQAGLTHSRGKMHTDIYRQVDDELLAELAAHQGRAAELARHLAALPDLDAWRKQLADVAGTFAEVIEDGLVAPETIAAALQRAGVRCWVEDGEVVKIEP
ncbi:MAG: recombinase family protein [Planctomycetaceae bacterium]|nr:MAG: recombinase family protein [Planctomycetaceae bacterium]